MSGFCFFNYLASLPPPPRKSHSEITFGYIFNDPFVEKPEGGAVREGTCRFESLMLSKDVKLLQ